VEGGDKDLALKTELRSDSFLSLGTIGRCGIEDLILALR
jgi:hypothetical protein